MAPFLRAVDRRDLEQRQHPPDCYQGLLNADGAGGQVMW
jgi:hypothetical protein